VNHRANRDIGNWHTVSRANIHLWTGNDRIANFQTNGGNHVALLAIRIDQQRQARRPVGIIFDRSNLCRNIELVALEIHQADKAAMTASLMAYSHTTMNVTTTCGTARHHQGTFRARLGNFFKRVTSHPPQTGSGWFVNFNSHYSTPSKIGILSSGARVTMAFL